MNSENDVLNGALNQRVEKALLEIAHAEPDFNARSFLEFFVRNRYFTPKQCSLLVSKLNAHGIPHNHSDFKISIRQTKLKEQLGQLPFTKVKEMWPYMSTNQRKFYNEEFAKFPLK